MRPAAERAGMAMRKLAQAASSHVGSDCYVHAAIGRELLKDLGVQTELKAGHAAWRLGPGDGDVMSHVDGVQGYLPEGAEGFAYHVWLETVEEGGASPILIDLTTYQLRVKATQLDEADGGTTAVDWCPDLLVLRREEIKGYREVAEAPGPGSSFYQSIPGMIERLAAAGDVYAEDLAVARLIMASPGLNVIGPNQTQQVEESVRYRPVG